MKQLTSIEHMGLYYNQQYQLKLQRLEEQRIRALREQELRAEEQRLQERRELRESSIEEIQRQLQEFKRGGSLNILI